tara:strand:- start:431 stop:1984 length:1554 start_codon:yes stop_codon:yes gene_type:complete
MFDHIFENRDKKVTNLIRLGDCLGRSLRENVSLFSIDSKNERVSYLTEGEKIISGEYSIKDEVKLDFIIVEDFDVYTNQSKFDTFVDSKVSLFVESLYSDDYSEAQNTFGDILDTWSSRLKFDETKTRLYEKNSKFNESQDILSTSEFHNFIDCSEQLSKFLSENADEVLNIPEITNGIRLSNTVSKAFNLPRLNYSMLQEEGTYRVPDDGNASIYEMVCRQELVKKELLESKVQFNDAWATNKEMQGLAGLIYEKDDNVILESLSKVIDEVPYFAFVSKKDIYTSIKNSLSISESVEVPDEHIRKYVAMIFEFKKPVKKELINVLNEKYGINVQNLKEAPTFKSLTNTQVVVLETLARVSPKGSTQKRVLREFAKSLQTKSGVQSLDVNDCLRLIFEAAGLSDLFEGEDLINHWDGDLSDNVEVENMYKDVVEYEGENDAIAEEDGDEDPEPQEADPVEKDPSPEEEEEKKVSSKDEADTEEEEIPKEEFYDAMKELESILGDLDQDSETTDEEGN